MSAKYVGSRLTLFFEIENTRRFFRVPHCAGSRLILFREMSRISKDGISQSCCEGQWSDLSANTGQTVTHDGREDGEHVQADV